MIKEIGRAVEAILLSLVAAPLMILVFVLVWLVITLLWMVLFVVIGIYNFGPTFGNNLSMVLGLISTLCFAYYKLVEED